MWLGWTPRQWATAAAAHPGHTPTMADALKLRAKYPRFGNGQPGEDVTDETWVKQLADSMRGLFV